MNEELKPCPFCGSDGYVQSYGTGGCYVPLCTKCPAALTPCYDERSKAVSDWNRRDWINQDHLKADEIVGDDCTPAYLRKVSKALTELERRLDDPT